MTLTPDFSAADAVVPTTTGDRAADSPTDATPAASVQILLLQAQQELAAGAFAAALVLLDRALTSAPADADLLYQRGLALQGVGNHDGAIALFDQLLITQPENANLWYQRGLALQALGDDATALTSYDQALALAPTPQMWRQRATVLRAQGDWAMALTNLDEALEHRPDWAAVWHERGQVLLALDDAARALVSLETALNFAAADPDLWLTRSTVLQKLGRWAEARTSLETAIAHRPDHPNLLPAIEALWDAGQCETAIVLGEVLLAHHPDHLAMRRQHSLWLYRLGRFHCAIEQFDQYLDAQPQDEAIWYRRGLALRRLGQVEGAIASFDLALDLAAEPGEILRSRLLTGWRGQRFGAIRRHPHALWLILRREVGLLLHSFVRTRLPVLLVIALAVFFSSRSRLTAFATAGTFLAIAVLNDLIVESRR